MDFGPFLRRAAVFAQGMKCAFILGTRECTSAAMGECAICHAPSCLEHAMHAVNGDMVCLVCVNEYAKIFSERSGRPRSERVEAKTSSKVPPAPASPPDEATLRAMHLSTLGLIDPANPEEIKSAFRELAKKHHPDRARGDAKKAAATKKFVQVKTAYEWLVQRTASRAA